MYQKYLKCDKIENSAIERMENICDDTCTIMQDKANEITKEVDYHVNTRPRDSHPSSLVENYNYPTPDIFSNDRAKMKCQTNAIVYSQMSTLTTSTQAVMK